MKTNTPSHSPVKLRVVTPFPAPRKVGAGFIAAPTSRLSDWHCQCAPRFKAETIQTAPTDDSNRTTIDKPGRIACASIVTNSLSAPQKSAGAYIRLMFSLHETGFTLKWFWPTRNWTTQ